MTSTHHFQVKKKTTSTGIIYGEEASFSTHTNGTASLKTINSGCNFDLTTNCYDFLTQVYAPPGTSILRPEDLGWLDLKKSQEWEDEVTKYFSSTKTPLDPYSPLSRELALQGGSEPPTQSVRALCFPLVEGATDYHWAVEIDIDRGIWAEQAGQGGPLRIWNDKDKMIKNIYTRRSDKGILFYVPKSHFEFNKFE